MSGSRISRLNLLRPRGYATVSGLSATARGKAEVLSADWKGTNYLGSTTKNYIGGEFTESKAEKWLEIHDPVCPSDLYVTPGGMTVLPVHTDRALESTRNDQR